MKGKKIIIILSLFFSFILICLNSMAKDKTERRSKLDLEYLFGRIESECLPDQIERIAGCTKSNEKNSSYNSKIFEVTPVRLDLRHPLTTLTISGIKFVKRNGESIRDNLLNSHYKQAKHRYHQMVDKFKDYAHFHHLNQEQRLSLSLCASSKILAYDKSNPEDAFHDGKTCDIISRGKGMCRQFTTVGLDISRKLGLTATRGHGKGHAYLIVKLHHKWYTTEPQHNSCVLLPLKNNSFTNALFSRTPFLFHKIPLPIPTFF